MIDAYDVAELVTTSRGLLHTSSEFRDCAVETNVRCSHALQRMDANEKRECVREFTSGADD